MRKHPTKTCFHNILASTKKGQIILLHVGNQVVPVKFECIDINYNCIVGTTQSGCRIFINSGCVFGFSFLESWPYSTNETSNKSNHFLPGKRTLGVEVRQRQKKHFPSTQESHQKVETIDGSFDNSNTMLQQNESLIEKIKENMKVMENESKSSIKQSGKFLTN